VAGGDTVALTIFATNKEQEDRYLNVVTVYKEMFIIDDSGHTYKNPREFTVGGQPVQAMVPTDMPTSVRFVFGSLPTKDGVVVMSAIKRVVLPFIVGPHENLFGRPIDQVVIAGDIVVQK
jgi:hypothetical protein